MGIHFNTNTLPYNTQYNTPYNTLYHTQKKNTSQNENTSFDMFLSQYDK